MYYISAISSHYSMCSIKEFYSKYNNDLELLTLFLDEQKADLEALHLSQLTTSI